MKKLTLGVSGYKLANKDLFSKSDPYLVISRPVSGGWTAIRTTETIKVTYYSTVKSGIREGAFI